MAYDRFLIAPLNSGLQTDLPKWQVMDDSWTSLNNAYVWRGRMRKRFGSRFMSATSDLKQAPLLSRLRTQYDNAAVAMVTDGAGNITAIVPGATGFIGQMFSIGDYTYTIISQAAGAQPMLTDDPAATVYTFNVTTGQVIITTATNHTTPVYFYPANPVMGLTNYKVGPINNQPSFGFDTQYIYKYTAGGLGWERSGTWVFQGNNSQFFWATNFRGTLQSDTYMFVSNFNATPGTPIPATDDVMVYYNGTIWQDFSALTVFKTTGEHVSSARIIVSFQNHLLLLNTIERDAAGTTNYAYPQRCRFSWNGDPTAAHAWLEPNQVGAGGGGYVDASTKEKIITAEFIKNHLIVYFERSTWELVWTGNEINPFTWQKLNSELGSEATFSVVPFDKVVLSVGNTGVHACNGVNTERIDSKIPNEVFQIQNKNEGVARVAGIRDYYTEMVYWTFPSGDYNTTFPNRVLVFNYNNGNWAFNDDCITVFGYYEQQSDVTWNSITQTWEDYTGTWNSAVQEANFRQVIGGNQEGFTFIVDADLTSNEYSMQITQMTPAVVPPVAVPVDVTVTAINHTLRVGEYFQIRDNDNFTGLDTKIFTVKQVLNANQFVFNAPSYAGTYKGNGYISRVSRIFAQSKQWNPYQKSGRNFSLNKIDFAVKATDGGQITVDYSPSSTSLSMIQEAQVTNSILGSGILETSPYPLYPLESEQITLWHPIYFNSDGEFIQITLTLSDSQMKTPAIVYEDFWLEGMILNTQPTSSRMQ